MYDTLLRNELEQANNSLEQLSCLSSGSSRLPRWAPVLVIPHHCIQHGEKLPHAGREGHLYLLSIRNQPSIEGLDRRVEAAGGECRLVEGGSQGSTSALDATLS